MSAARRLRAVPPPAPDAYEPDRWRIAGHRLKVPAELPADRCTGDHGLCGVCRGSRCLERLDPAGATPVNPDVSADAEE